MALAHVYFSGRVQGVFFRAFTRDVASGAGLTGWVKNLYDGRVEALFEGERSSIEEAIKTCTKGPPGAKVTDTAVEWHSYTGEFRGFEVKHW